MPSAWLRRNVFHPCDGGALLRAIYLATLVWPISIPSLRSSPYSRRSPQRIGEAHLADQPANFQRHRWSAAAASRFPAPIRSEARAVPSYNGVRLNDRKRTTSLREQPVKANENQSVNEVESKLARRPSPKHIDLLPQDQNLGLKRSSRPEKIREHPPDQSAQVQHHATASPDSRSTTSRIWFAVGTPETGVDDAAWVVAPRR